jgi:hypothetical protein
MSSSNSRTYFSCVVTIHGFGLVGGEGQLHGGFHETGLAQHSQML